MIYFFPSILSSFSLTTLSFYIVIFLTLLPSQVYFFLKVRFWWLNPRLFSNLKQKYCLTNKTSNHIFQAQLLVTCPNWEEKEEAENDLMVCYLLKIQNFQFLVLETWTFTIEFTKIPTILLPITAVFYFLTQRLFCA